MVFFLLDIFLSIFHIFWRSALQHVSTISMLIIPAFLAILYFMDFSIFIRSARLHVHVFHTSSIYIFYIFPTSLQFSYLLQICVSACGHDRDVDIFRTSHNYVIFVTSVSSAAQHASMWPWSTCLAFLYFLYFSGFCNFLFFCRSVFQHVSTFGTFAIPAFLVIL